MKLYALWGSAGGPEGDWVEFRAILFAFLVFVQADAVALFCRFYKNRFFIFFPCVITEKKEGFTLQDQVMRDLRLKGSDVWSAVATRTIRGRGGRACCWCSRIHLIRGPDCPAENTREIGWWIRNFFYLLLPFSSCLAFSLVSKKLVGSVYDVGRKIVLLWLVLSKSSELRRTVLTFK